MKDVHLVVGIAAIALNGVAFLFGVWCWRNAESSVWFWRLLRAALSGLARLLA